ncbi:hypothetical protein M0R45_000576 [Rubus argutus]|uniref:Uncharacterized protein n=1 Tax=Rubus argutus TaxID=59490 RepID=A0AAW1VP17_RUBAR
MALPSGLEIPKEALDAEIKSFFESAPSLKNSDDVGQKLEEFVKKNSLLSGNGGARRVRSSFHRVLFEGRLCCYLSLSEETCQPYCRSLPDDPLLECLEIVGDSNIQVHQFHSQAVRTAITKTHAVWTSSSRGLLLKLPFTTIFEYLQMLQMVAFTMRNIGPHAMFYLAAAVSDFYVPWTSMVVVTKYVNLGSLIMFL